MAKGTAWAAVDGVASSVGGNMAIRLGSLGGLGLFDFFGLGCVLVIAGTLDGAEDRHVGCCVS